MKPKRFNESNFFIPAMVQESPDKKAEQTALHFFQEGNVCVSCWEPTDEELKQIIEKREVWLILPMKQQPAANVITSSPFRPREVKTVKVLGLDGNPITTNGNENKDEASTGNDK